MGWWQRLGDLLRGRGAAPADGPAGGPQMPDKAPDQAPSPPASEALDPVPDAAGETVPPHDGATPEPPGPGPSLRFWVDHNEFDDPDEMLAGWLAQIPDPGIVEELVVGSWPAPYDRPSPVKALAAVALDLPRLRFLRIGDMGSEDCEMSWITHDWLDPVLGAYCRQLTRLEVQGSQGLRMNPFTSRVLESLTFECGGLPGMVVESLAESTLPALTRLELWLGTEEYGGDVTEEQLRDLFHSDAAPALEHLGLLNSEDPLRDLTALAGSPWLERISSLDLSLGVIGDECVEILTSGSFGDLTTLTVKDHHYLTTEDARRITAGLPGVRVEISAGEEPDEDDDDGWDNRERYRGRWVSVGE